jgi:demethylmenaquinone methyltransferase/2-methoxy-6-polyprenyl-1,4-benzoquinol methylase
MSTDSTIISYYAQRAAEYERIYDKPERQADLARLRSLVKHLFTGKDVLEVACGTGYWTEVVVQSAASVLALDVNDEVLDIARAKPLDRRKVRFQRADIYALPAFPDVFTGSLAVFWWSHVPKQRLGAFLRGLHRAFAPGTRVVFIDNVYVEGSSTPISRGDADGNTYQKRQLDDGSTHEVLKNFPTEQELCAAVADLACEARVEFLKYYWMLSYVSKAQR